jgi:hypothetical protein
MSACIGIRARKRSFFCHFGMGDNPNSEQENKGTQKSVEVQNEVLQKENAPDQLEWENQEQFIWIYTQIDVVKSIKFRNPYMRVS